MSKGKFEAKPKAVSKLRVITAVLAVVMVLVGMIGGTVAWLVSAPEPVVNTFTYGDIDITLKETDTNLDDDDDPNTNDYEMMPGQDIDKDPTVTVKAGSENMWLFVKLEKSDNFDDFLTFLIADGWAQLYDDQGNAVEGVYYRFQSGIAADGEDVAIPVLKDNQVTVREDVTKEMLNALDPEGQEANYPTLTITAYAVQYVGFEAVVEEGNTEATPEAVNAAALKAWTEAAAPQNPPTNP